MFHPCLGRDGDWCLLFTTSGMFDGDLGKVPSSTKSERSNSNGKSSSGYGTLNDHPSELMMDESDEEVGTVLATHRCTQTCRHVSPLEEGLFTPSEPLY